MLQHTLPLILASALLPPAAAQSVYVEELSPAVGQAPPPSIFLPDGIRFGEDVAISGQWAAVASPREASSDSGVGMVTIYALAGDHWIERQTFYGTGGQYGFSLDLHGDYLVVGEIAPGPPGPFPVPSLDTAFLHVYELDTESSLWFPTQTEQITTQSPGLELNYLVSDLKIAAGSQAFAVGSPDEGAVYVYDRIAGQFLLTARLEGDDFGFGRDLDIEDNLLVVSYPNYPGIQSPDPCWVGCDPCSCVVVPPIHVNPSGGYNVPDGGAVSVYRDSGSGWESVNVLVPSDFADPEGWFCRGHVEVSDGRILASVQGALEGTVDFFPTPNNDFVQVGGVQELDYEGEWLHLELEEDRAVFAQSVPDQPGDLNPDVHVYYRERYLLPDPTGQIANWRPSVEVALESDSWSQADSLGFSEGRLLLGDPFQDGQSASGGDPSGRVDVYHLPRWGTWWTDFVEADVIEANGDVLIDDRIGDIQVRVTRLAACDPYPDLDEIEVDFRLAREELDNCYDFRWVQVVLAETENGAIVVEDETVGILPAFDPTTSAGGPDWDDEPFYWNQDEILDGISDCTGAFDVYDEGEFSILLDSPWSPAEDDAVIYFRTFLVAREIAPTSIPEDSYLVLHSMDWRYFSNGHRIIPLPAQEDGIGAIAAAQVSADQPGHIGHPGFPSWNAVEGLSLTACPSLYSDVSSLSVSLGGTQQLTLAPGVEYADALYIVLGSASGTSPGFDIGGGAILPLNFDNYTQLTLSNPNSLYFESTAGLIQANGTQGASIELPAGMHPELAGVELHHAYAALNGEAAPFFTSNPVSLTLVP